MLGCGGMGFYAIYAVIAVVVVGFSIRQVRAASNQPSLEVLDQLIEKLLRVGPLSAEEKAAASNAVDPLEKRYEAAYSGGYPPEGRLELLIARSKLALIDPENHGGWPIRMGGRDGLVKVLSAHPGMHSPRQAFAFVIPALIGGAPEVATAIFHQLQQQEPQLANAVYGWVRSGATKYPELNPPEAFQPWLAHISG